MVVLIMKFESKAELIKELISGKRFRNSEAEIYYSENDTHPFRFRRLCWSNGHSVVLEASWMDYNKDIWEEVTPRHVRQDLIDSYVVGQAWQAYNKSNGEWYNLRKSNTWLQPGWDANTEYRLHPHNEVIQAHRNGAKIQTLYGGVDWHDDENPLWSVNSKYRVKPATKTLYEWMYKAKYSKKWSIEPRLMTEEEASDFYTDFEYKKTGRSFEVEV